MTALIGEGSTGQVWQVTDTQLGRQVALKILPDAFAADPDRLARVQREAQILVSLNHPNSAAIYGIEESDDTRALILAARGESPAASRLPALRLGRIQAGILPRRALSAGRIAILGATRGFTTDC